MEADAEDRAVGRRHPSKKAVGESDRVTFREGHDGRVGVLPPMVAERSLVPMVQGVDLGLWRITEEDPTLNDAGSLPARRRILGEQLAIAGFAQLGGRNSSPDPSRQADRLLAPAAHDQPDIAGELPDRRVLSDHRRNCVACERVREMFKKLPKAREPTLEGYSVGVEVALCVACRASDGDASWICR